MPKEERERLTSPALPSASYQHPHALTTSNGPGSSAESAGRWPRTWTHLSPRSSADIL